jgi:hypothetical protein
MIINPLDLDIVERLRLEEEFFAQPYMMSYSGLNKLAYSPGAFYQHYVLKQRDDTVDKAAAEGKLLHCKILNPEEFDKEFIILPDTFPSDNPKKVLDKLFVKLKSENPDLASIPLPLILSEPSVHDMIMELLQEENLYQSLKTDGQRLDKMLTEKNISYLQFLILSGSRTIVDQAMVTFADRAKDAFMARKNVREIMALDDFSTARVKVFNEISIASFPEQYSFGLRGIIDNLVIDHDNKVIRINDLKKSSKALNNFQDSIEYYKYWIQAAMYYKLLLSNRETGFSVDYPIEFRFIVIDPYMHIGVLKVSDATMDKWLDDTNALLKVAKFHFDSRDFSLPHEFLMSDTHEHVI